MVFGGLGKNAVLFSVAGDAGTEPAEQACCAGPLLTVVAPSRLAPSDS